MSDASKPATPAATVASEPSSAASFVASLFAPDPMLNYDFIAACYLFLVIVSLAMAGVEYSRITGVSEVIAGFWIVPAPCVLALLWTLFLRSRVAPKTKKE